jgi:hypothetical protein
MAKTDLALINSEVNATVTLVHSELINYTEAQSGKDAETDLDRFTGMTDGYMDEIHDIRKQYHADIAVLVEYLSGIGGIGWVLNSIDGKVDRAFNVVRVQQIYNNTTVIHEIGHNMGMCHERENNNMKNPLFPYAYGWYWTGNDGEKYGSVMSYTGDETPYFSNPNTYYQGHPTGVADVADNTKVFRKTKQQVAFYSDRIDNFPDIPTNITVSNPNENGATFSWKAANNAVKYRICSPIGGGSYRYWETPSTIGTIRHDMFSPCNTYEFWIMAINNCGDGVSSQIMTFTTACPVRSSDANLSSLLLSSNVKLTPDFSPVLYNYTATVPNDFTNINIAATASDNKATVKGNGAYPLNIGENTIRITVTAGDGTTNVYTLIITREDSDTGNRNIAAESDIIIYTKGSTLSVKSVIAMKSVKVYAITGQLVRLENANSTEVSIDKLPKGIYIMRIVLEGDNVEMKKVFIK